MTKASEYPIICCTPKSLPKHQTKEASDHAREVNPVNGVRLEKLLRLVPDLHITAERIAVVTDKFLGALGAAKIPVSFFEGTKAAQIKILKFANLWGKTANVKFLLTRGTGFIRVALQEGEGYWSYLGTDARFIPHDQQTLNLDSFTEGTPDSEYYRVVCHEFGHALGCPHEHLRDAEVHKLDRAKTIAYFMATQGWTEQEVIAQVLTPLSERSLLNPTPADELSIMCYQIPGELTIDGKPIPGGSKIDKQDASYMGKVYPKKKS